MGAIFGFRAAASGKRAQVFGDNIPREQAQEPFGGGSAAEYRRRRLRRRREVSSHKAL
ncbi:MAG: hypothetical protein ACK4ME_04230 [Fimbriimonadales bacterium]